VNELADVVRTIPQFVYKRQDWSIIHPWVDLTSTELTNLASSGSAYVAGFTDASVAIREDLYDLLIDVNSGTVAYASHAADSFGLGKVHKEIAMYMVDAGEDKEVSDQELLKELVNKTDMLIGGLERLAHASKDDSGKLVVTVEAIRARKMAKSMHVFLYNLAVAEGMVE
jgi:hypothetical protein